MRTSIFRCCLAAICAVSLLFCLAGAPAYAQKAEAEGPFPDDVIVVPQGTEISINDDAGTVTITDSPVEIAEGRWWSFKEIEDNLGKSVFTPNFEQEFAGIKDALLALL